MPTFIVKNVALDPKWRQLRAVAAKMEMEPTIAGQRLYLRSSIRLNEHQFAVNEAALKKLVGQGVVEVTLAMEPVKFSGEVPAPAPVVVPVEVPAPVVAEVTATVEPAPEATPSPAPSPTTPGRKKKW